MKISWGTKIVILYSSFVAMIAVLVFLSVNQKIELESKDYYAKELAFQSRIDASQNANAFAHSITYEKKSDYLILEINPVFLSTDFKGELYCYRSSDSDLDKKIPLQFDANHQQFLNIKDFKKGYYDLEFSWSSHTKPYFKKIQIHI